LGSVLIAPGLHYAGPDDPRFDRFCRVLARSGALVLAPFLPTYLQMDVTPSAIDELSASLDVLLALPDRPARKPSVFSISFGSMPALRLAGRRGDELSSVVIFGGFSGFQRTLRFALEGDAVFGGGGLRKHDPLNAPVVVQNLLRFVTPRLNAAELDEVRKAFRAYCMATWGKPEMKVDRGFEASALAIAANLNGPVREVFLKATRVEPGVEEMVQDALTLAAGAFDWMDPAPHLGRLPVPVTIVHGRDDDVIPFEESLALAEGLRVSGTDVRLHLTGMFGHTGKASLGELFERASEGADEVRAVIAMLRALASL
jgi:pimeloyl-ACP methyl ester carboxylesterase